MPQRIQRRRVKGWRMPEGAIYVGRPTLWGNPFGPEDFPTATVTDGVPWERQWREHAVTLYLRELDAALSHPYERPIDIKFRTIAAKINELSGHDLCCWCPLDMSCHADVLLQIDNIEVTS